LALRDKKFPQIQWVIPECLILGPLLRRIINGNGIHGSHGSSDTKYITVERNIDILKMSLFLSFVSTHFLYFCEVTPIRLEN